MSVDTRFSSSAATSQSNHESDWYPMLGHTAVQQRCTSVSAYEYDFYKRCFLKWHIRKLRQVSTFTVTYLACYSVDRRLVPVGYLSRGQLYGGVQGSIQARHHRPQEHWGQLQVRTTHIYHFSLQYSPINCSSPNDYMRFLRFYYTTYVLMTATPHLYSSIKTTLSCTAH